MTRQEAIDLIRERVYCNIDKIDRPVLKELLASGIVVFCGQHSVWLKDDPTRDARIAARLKHEAERQKAASGH